MKQSQFKDIIYQANLVASHTALACFNEIGKGNEKIADQVAVNCMRQCLNKMSIDGKVVIGEGERDKAPMLYSGEKVGLGGRALDIALDPLEGTTICATGNNNSLVVIAFADKGKFLSAPDVYMDKIAIGPHLPKDIVSLDNSVKDNLTNLSKAKKCNISDLRVIILNRPRHQEIISQCRALDTKVKLINDGDISAIISIFYDEADIYIGIGGAPEGVLASAALNKFNCQMRGRLLFNNDKNQIKRAKEMGIEDLNKEYSLEEMTKDNSLFIAAAVTSGDFLDGIKKNKNFSSVSSLVIDSSVKTITKNKINIYHE